MMEVKFVQTTTMVQPDHKAQAATDSLSGEPVECDYDVDCVQLYKRLEAEEFGAVYRFLESGLWPQTFFKDTNKPADHVKTWVTRFEDKAKTKVKWSQLPLHLALVQGAPYEIITRLVDLYPVSARCTDDQFMLPLHLALRHGLSDRIIECLLRAFPEAVNALGKSGRSSIDCAKRGPKKLRATILEAFVKGTTKKVRKNMAAAHKLEMDALKRGYEVERNKVMALESGIKILEAQVKHDIKATKERSSNEIEQIVADCEKKLSEIDLSKKEVELELARKKDELQAVRQSIANAKVTRSNASLGAAVPSTTNNLLNDWSDDNDENKALTSDENKIGKKSKAFFGRLGRRPRTSKKELVQDALVTSKNAKTIKNTILAPPCMTGECELNLATTSEQDEEEVTIAFGSIKMIESSASSLKTRTLFKEV